MALKEEIRLLNPDSGLESVWAFLKRKSKRNMKKKHPNPFNCLYKSHYVCKSEELMLAVLSFITALNSTKTCVGGLRERPPQLDPKPGILF